MVSDSERTKILEMIESGTITADEGLTLLNALSGVTEIEGMSEQDLEENLSPGLDQHDDISFGEQVDLTPDSEEDSQVFEGQVEVLPPPPEPPDPQEIQRWKQWWVIPLWVGVGFTVLGGLLMFWAFSASGFGFWFACTWFPFLLGVALLAFAWNSRTSPWIHVRVHQAPGKSPKKIAISFPIPVRFSAWILRTFGHYIPHMEGTNLDEVILALKDVSQEDAPLIVDVEDGEDGERVQVYIG